MPRVTFFLPAEHGPATTPNPSLTTAGVLQALALRPDAAFDAVFCSPMACALQTVHCSRMVQDSCPLVVTALAREFRGDRLCDYMEWERPHRDVETEHEFTDRVAALVRALATSGYRSVAVVTHDMVIDAIAGVTLFQPCGSVTMELHDHTSSAP
jgi:broad specificity phosphatase PhoE